MADESITAAFSREHSGHRPPTTLLILFEIISLAVFARVSWRRGGNRFLFWGLIAVIAVVATLYSLLFRDVPLRPAY
jgi:hypothetical protein